MLPETLAFVDIETTGGSLFNDRIIEIGIIRVENNVVCKTLESLINPQTYVSPFIEQLTGINSQELERAPSWRQLMPEVLDVLEDAIFVAHNVRFDYGFIKHECKRQQLQFNKRHFCTVKLSRSLFPHYKHHNLDSIIKRFNLPFNHRHRALGDAQVLWDFYQLLQQKFPTSVLAEKIKSALKKPSIPVNLSALALNHIPESAGIYFFYGENDLPLYIGKSVNLKSRVEAHFAADHQSSTEMKIAQQIRRISTIQTAGELGALIRESELIKQHKPLYNKQLRTAHKIIVAHKKTTNAGYYTVDLQTTELISHLDLDHILGVFKSKKKATDCLLTLAKEYRLCQKILGLEHGSGSCFGYQLGTCAGACVSKERTAFYNVRFIEAFSALKIEAWPYSSAIAVTEISDEIRETFIIDHWCLLGSISGDDYGSQTLKHTEEVFDYDVYKILRLYLRKPKIKRSIKLVGEKQKRTFLTSTSL